MPVRTNCNNDDRMYQHWYCYYHNIVPMLIFGNALNEETHSEIYIYKTFVLRTVRYTYSCIIFQTFIVHIHIHDIWLWTLENKNGFSERRLVSKMYTTIGLFSISMIQPNYIQPIALTSCSILNLKLFAVVLILFTENWYLIININNFIIMYNILL